MKKQLFQYAIVWHPTEKEIKDEGKKSILLAEVRTILAANIDSAAKEATFSIPDEYRDKLDQVEVIIRPF